MSHWTVARVKIANPDPQLLRQALEVIAKELGAEGVAENYRVVGYHAAMDCLYAIPMRLPWGNGYGVYVDQNGELRVVVDDHGAPLTAEEFAQRLAQYYTVLAVYAAAQQLGFSVTAQQLEQGVLLDLTR